MFIFCFLRLVLFSCFCFCTTPPKIFLGGSLCCCYSYKIFNHTRVLCVNVFRFDRFAKVTVKDWIFGLANSEKWWLLEFSSHRVVVAVVNLCTYIQTYIDFLSFSLCLCFITFCFVRYLFVFFFQFSIFREQMSCFCLCLFLSFFAGWLSFTLGGGCKEEHNKSESHMFLRKRGEKRKYHTFIFELKPKLTKSKKKKEENW